MANSTTGEDIEAVRDDLEAIKAQLASLMKHVGSATVSKAGQLYENVRDERAEELRKQVRDHPLTSVVLAFVAGTVFANIMRSR